MRVRESFYVSDGPFGTIFTASIPESFLIAVKTQPAIKQVRAVESTLLIWGTSPMRRQRYRSNKPKNLVFSFSGKKSWSWRTGSPSQGEFMDGAKEVKQTPERTLVVGSTICGELKWLSSSSGNRTGKSCPKRFSVTIKNFYHLHFL